MTFHTQGDLYNESLPIDVVLEPKTLLAYGIGCSTLPLEHGFPLRLIVPRKFGYKSCKYVYRIELTDKPISGYWVARGYPYEGDVPKSRLRLGKY
ncbi:MAG: molybdopterin-dependent oxidoreductase [Proteobacteria bacterium]|nr:molybdopterin-dependent oxidoreductase [Pseudomonadota bacterium]